MPNRITTYKQAFEEVIGLRYDDKRVQAFIKRMEKLGHTEHGICFSIWKARVKIIPFLYDYRLFSVLENEVKKWSWPKGDPRWDAYHKRKAEEAKVEEARKQLDCTSKMPQSEIQRYIEAFPTKKKQGYVYFVQGESGGAIKIGHSLDPQGRLKGLQTGYPDTLTLLLLIPGGEDVERAYHRKFAAFSLRGEWFKPDEKLVNEIANLRAKQAVLGVKEKLEVPSDHPHLKTPTPF